jgi:hypothetical protein
METVYLISNPPRGHWFVPVQWNIGTKALCMEMARFHQKPGVTIYMEIIEGPTPTSHEAVV